MLQLPDTSARSRKINAGSRAGSKTPSASKQLATHKRLCDLEVPICDAKIMSSVLSVLADKLAQNALAFRGLPDSITANTMAEEINEHIERVLFVAHKVEKILRDLEEEYLAPLEDAEAGVE